jgi:hypothetical protein
MPDATPNAIPEMVGPVYAARPHAERVIRSQATIRRTRTLAYRGRVTRQVNDRVAADSVVAEATVPQGYRLLQVDEALGVSRRSAHNAMLKQIGDVVERGEVIARTKGLRKREYLVPVGGQIVDIAEGQVQIEAMPQRIELLALYPGLIADVIPARGVVIETTGSLVQGTWGYGRARRTTLICAAPAGDVPLLGGQLSGEHLGMVVLGGRTLDANTIAQAVEMRVRGIIVGSIDSALLPAIGRSGLSVIVTEGFGNIPMHPKAFKVLAACEGQEVCFQPATQVDWKTQRPEVFCFVPDRERPVLTESSPSLCIGDRVRILRAPHHNAEGEILAFSRHPRRLASGITAQGAEIDLGTAETVFVPLQNLEIIR